MDTVSHTFSLRDKVLVGGTIPKWAVVLIGLALTVAWSAAIPRIDPPILVVMPLIVPAVVAFALKLPGAVLAAFIYIPFYKASVQAFLPLDLTVMLAIACTGLAIPLLLQIKGSGLLRPLSLWGGVVALIAFGTLYASDPDAAFSDFLSFVLLAYLPLHLCMRVGNRRDFVMQFLAATAALSIVVTVLGLYEMRDLTGWQSVAPLSTTINTGRSALLLPLIAPSLLSTRLRWLGILGIAISPLALLVAFASGSRGPLLMAVLAIAIITLLHRERIGTKLALGLLVLVVATTLLQSPQAQELLPARSVARVQTLVEAVFGGGELDSSSLTRISIMSLALDMFLARPILGYGTAGFATVTAQLPEVSHLTYPHNIVLQIAAEYGVLGLLLLCAFLGWALVNGVKRIRDPYTRAITILTVFAVLNALVSNGMDNRWFWGMVLLLGSYGVSAYQQIGDVPAQD